MKTTRLGLTTLATATLMLLTACGESDSSDSRTDSAAGSATLGEEPSGSSAGSVEVVETGFGQRDEYVQGIAVVTAGPVGEFVTVSMNFLDASGQVVATEEQVESVARDGDELVLPVWLSLDDPKVKIASVEATASISDYGSAEEDYPDLGTFETTEIISDGYNAKFRLTNPTDEAVESARIGVVCYSAGGDIIGGGSDYPNLWPANGEIVVEASITTSGKPAKCVAHARHEGL
ncbi:hypothetical protein [Nocardioides renjunii]|uniref:hypothetical protein n=1 Tax=Nocardioides renjunii TaxID=3095075 RepID=UPI002B00263A|nr:hypothetical protein [Nocardioides sp. S-34]WQQ21978.1 hypothetical protein SHK17_19070 [Nocardioides sp. S-34]